MIGYVFVIWIQVSCYFVVVSNFFIFRLKVCTFSVEKYVLTLMPVSNCYKLVHFMQSKSPFRDESQLCHGDLNSYERLLWCCLCFIWDRLVKLPTHAAVRQRRPMEIYQLATCMAGDAHTFEWCGYFYLEFWGIAQTLHQQHHTFITEKIRTASVS